MIVRNNKIIMMIGKCNKLTVMSYNQKLKYKIAIKHNKAYALFAIIF